MKRTPPCTRAAQRGYATVVVVSSMSLVILGMLGYTLLGSLRTFDSSSRAQVKQDYSQKENAILNSLVQIVPNKAIGAMRQGSASNASAFTWETIFREAIASANAEQSVSSQMVNALGLSNAIVANPGDTQFGSMTQLVKAPVGTPSGGINFVNGGNSLETMMLADARIGPRVPAALAVSNENYLLDKLYPIISHLKTHTTSYTKGLGLSPTHYPRYNLLQYPDVKFAFKRPGEYFVAKRNWWVFSLEFGSHNQQTTGIPPVRKDYVLSIYEIPSQAPLSASTLLKVGKFADGTNWQNVSLDGALVADRLQTEGNVSVSNGAISARRSLTVSGQASVNGKTITNNFDALGAREARATSANGATGGNQANTSTDSDFFEASVGGNVGKVAFLPINAGTNSLLNLTDGNRSERISPTGWNEYTMAGTQATMTLEVRTVTSSSNQTPTAIRFRYRNSSNSIATVTYTRGSNWPTDLQSGGPAFPFQTDTLDSTRRALIIHMDRLPAFINSLSSTGGMSRNNSLYIFCRTDSSSVRVPSIPAAANDMVVSLRGGKDMSAYTSGFSLVSRYRVYIADSINDVPVARPANSGLPADHIYYPPLSIFAPEKRFGESLAVSPPVLMKGQLNSLKSATTDTVNPLELRSGNDQRLTASRISAELTSLKSPAELPPIHQMNWMVTVEEIQ